MTDISGASLEATKTELNELIKDRIAFLTAYDLIRKRLLESSELDLRRQPLLHEWSGSRSVCGSLEMSIHSIERTIEEYMAIIRRLESGEVRNIDVPLGGPQ